MTRDIIVNGRFLARRVTGVERYGRELISLFRDNYRVERTRANGVAGHAWEQFILPAKLWTQTARHLNTQQRADAFHNDSILWSPANTGPLMIRNQALTIHDLSPLEHPEWFRKSFAIWYRLFLPILAKRVRIVFTPSEYVRQKVMKRFGIMNVTITPNGVDTSIFHPEAQQNTFEFPEKYILFVGSLQPRKNLESLMWAWREIKNEFSDTWLVVAGEAGYVFRSVKFISAERVRFLGYVSDDDLPGLYANAKLFALPSLDEGSGLSALEAMACGTPVIVSNGGALPEIVGDAGLIFDLSKPDSLFTVIKQCLNDNDLCMSLKEKGLVRAKLFSWKQTAELIWSKLNE